MRGIARSSMRIGRMRSRKPTTSRPPRLSARHWRHIVLFETIGSGAFGDRVSRLGSDARPRCRCEAVPFETARPVSPLEEGRHLARCGIRTWSPSTAPIETATRRASGWSTSRATRSRAWCAITVPRALARSIGVGVDLCRALAALHGAGLLHRDIKAQNVMREVGGRIVLMDFSGAQTIAREGGRWSRRALRSTWRRSCSITGPQLRVRRLQPWRAALLHAVWQPARRGHTVAELRQGSRGRPAPTPARSSTRRARSRSFKSSIARSCPTRRRRYQTAGEFEHALVSRLGLRRRLGSRRDSRRTRRQDRAEVPGRG